MSRGTAAREMSWALTLLLVFALLGQRAAGAQDVAEGQMIDRLVADHVDRELLSGVILVAENGLITFQKAFGFANWELRVPNSPATRFGIGSITKTLTQLVVGQLVAEGRIDPESLVRQYIAGFPRGPDGGEATIRDLLDHRSGVPHRVTTPAEETQWLPAEAIVERVKKSELLFEPGTERLYSSAGYTSLARIVEIVEGKPFEAAMSERVFVPSGMSSAASESGQRLMPRRATPYRLGSEEQHLAVKSAPYKDLRFLTGAGSVFATAEDLVALVAAIQRGTLGEEARARIVGGDPPGWRGWTGRTNGYEASVDFLPAEGLTFVFLSNLQSASNWQVREQVKRILEGQAPHLVPIPPPVRASSDRPESLVGVFGPATITLVDGKHFRGDNEFYATDRGEYYVPASGTTMRFRRDSSGFVDAIVSMSPGGTQTVLPRSAGQ